MNITLFSEVTTEQALLAIEKEAQNNIGIYVEMNDPKQRKYIKDQAIAINTLLKTVDRERISIAKKHKINVEAQAADIRARLEKANEPFAVLIDGYNTERKRILDADKARKAAEEAAIQKECDHEYAIILDKSYLADKLVEDARIEAERIQNNQRIAEQAKVDAELAAKKLIDDANTAKQQAIDDKMQADKELIEQQARASLAAEQAETKRLADIETARLQEAQRQAHAQKQLQNEADQRAADTKNTRVIHRSIYQGFVAAGLTADCAKLATQALIDSQINHVTINY